MASFGKTSNNRLRTVHPLLRLLFEAVVEDVDCKILEGHRGETLQNELFRAHPQRSKVPWPNSKHNVYPSKAIDAAPWPVPDWNDREAFLLFGAYVKGRADALGVRIRWGGDWDGDGSTRDQTFDDQVHFELIDD